MVSHVRSSLALGDAARPKNAWPLCRVGTAEVVMKVWGGGPPPFLQCALLHLLSSSISQTHSSKGMWQVLGAGRGKHPHVSPGTVQREG